MKFVHHGHGVDHAQQLHTRGNDSKDVETEGHTTERYNTFQLDGELLKLLCMPVLYVPLYSLSHLAGKKTTYHTHEYFIQQGK